MATAAPAKERRKLRFETVDEAIAEAERLAEADREGRLTQAGNWTLGQALGHCATWADFAFDGYPRELHPPSLVKIIARLLRRRILTKGMMPGMRIGRLPEGTVGLDKLPTDEGLARFRAAFQRLGATSPTIENPALGQMTHEQWIALNLRHAELHLGFLIPG